jgi:RNA polymerase sigma-70 factor, ECF subfamily
MHSIPGAQSQISAILGSTADGDTSALDRLVPLLYEELRTLAHAQLCNEYGEHTLHTTALVHEAYLKLARNDRITSHGRAYFFAAAARAMRQVLVDRARRRHATKRGGGVEHVTLDADDAAVDAYALELLDLDAALNRLARLSPRQAQVVEHRFFAGMSVAETAQALGVSARTIELDWMTARAWLLRELGRDMP